jgi:hypothetical protein
MNPLKQQHTQNFIFGPNYQLPPDDAQIQNEFFNSSGNLAAAI